MDNNLAAKRLKWMRKTRRRDRRDPTIWFILIYCTDWCRTGDDDGDADNNGYKCCSSRTVWLSYALSLHFNLYKLHVLFCAISVMALQ